MIFGHDNSLHMCPHHCISAKLPLWLFSTCDSVTCPEFYFFLVFSIPLAENRLHLEIPVAMRAHSECAPAPECSAKLPPSTAHLVDYPPPEILVCKGP